MNHKDNIRMAREAGFAMYFAQARANEFSRFAALVAAAERQACAAHYLDIARKAIEEEREACAKVCDAIQKKHEDEGAWLWEAKNCAAAIRARSKQ